VFFIGAVSIFLVQDDLRAGAVSAVSGAIVEFISGLNFWLYGRTASQMNLFHIRLEQTQKCSYSACGLGCVGLGPGLAVAAGVCLVPDLL